MKAIILAGGFGNRLKPITDFVPKPLVPIRNIPIIEWQIKYLKKYGIDEIIVSAGYKSKMIQSYLDIKKNNDVNIEYSIEDTPLGTGGAIKKAGKLIKDDSFFVINGDIITNISLKKLSEKINSIASIELRTNYGILETNQDKITSFNEKKEVNNLWMNAGIYYLDKKILKDLPKKGDIERTLFSNYAKNNKLYTVKFKKVKWFSIDSFKDMQACSDEIKNIIK